MVKSINRILYL